MTPTPGNPTASPTTGPTTGPTTTAGALDTAPVRLAVLAASVRRERQGRHLADWVHGRVTAAGVGTVDLIDLAECVLPDDELLLPGGGRASPISDRIEAADGYVVVTPEYNHSYPASLKRAIDWHYGQWQLKAATVVSYGVHGGLLATEHLRSVFAELSVVTARRVVGIRAPWDQVRDDRFEPEDGLADALDAAVAELVWWAETLRQARRDRPFPS